MSLRIAIKDHIRETQLFNQRAVAFLVISALLMLFVVTRLFYLQVASHEHFTTLSTKNRLRVVPVAPTRGLIYDRNGIVLAQNLPSFVLNVVPEQVEDMAATLAQLRELIYISSNDVAVFEKIVKRSPSFSSVPLRFHLNDEEVARFAVNRHRFSGVDIEARLTRHYPLGELAAHVVGYVGRISEDELPRIDTANYGGTDHIGKTGVEKYYENILHGTVGHQEVETNAQGRLIRRLKGSSPTPGQNIYLNIDANLQRIARKAFGENNASLVAIEPATGAVLALVNAPSFDPNLFVNGIDPKAYKALTDSLDQPLFNRALNGQYPPGSTIKPFLGLAGLEFGTIDHETHVACVGHYLLEGDRTRRKYRDWKKKGHGITALDKAIVQSCDVYFYDLAHKLGIGKMSEFLGLFGVGKKTGIDIHGELSGLNPSREWKRNNRGQVWYPGETLITGIGQGYLLTTPLQLAAITATMANRGKQMQPAVLQAIQDPITNAIDFITPIKLNTIIFNNQDNVESVIRSMKSVVHSLFGTARRIGVDSPYKIAGKTGTAQVFGIKQDEEYDETKIKKKLQDHALFIGFAPVENPQIAVATVVENGGHGGSVAAPIVREVMDAFILQ
ncbi:MAG: penicillin-binding protein 2 [Gammaproteobacteria bacterium]|nr:penicillin-binding protein 2 [Gammaproteobacteria bacterium]